MSRRTQQQLVNQRFANIQNSKARKSSKWDFSDKTGWDWLDMSAKLAIPIVVLIATIGLGLWQAHLADLQHQSDQKIAQLQHQQDQASALDQERATTLQTYIDNIQDLLLNHNLLESKPTDNIAILAQARTLTALRGLDPMRKGQLLAFIYEAKLIGFIDPNNRTYAPIILLSGADLSYTTLYGTILSGADLSYARLDFATFGEDNFAETNLSYADLTGANISNSLFFRTDFTRAILDGTNFNHTYLYSSYLTNALYFTQQQLDQVHSCQGATLPRGLICHHNQ